MCRRWGCQRRSSVCRRSSSGCQRRSSGCCRRRCSCLGSSCRRFCCSGICLNSSQPTRNLNELLIHQSCFKVLTQMSYRGFEIRIWFSIGLLPFAYGLHGIECLFGWRDKLVCMPVSNSRDLVWMRDIWFGCFKNWVGFWSIWFAVGLLYPNHANHGKPIGEF